MKSIESITIRGPHGSFEVCANSGQIITPYSQIPREYRHYSSAKVEAHRQWCATQGMELVKDVPILCISLRRFDGKVDALEKVYREEWVYQLINPTEALAA